MDTKSTSIIGLVILAVLLIGAVLWYMSEHPAPVTIPHGGTGTGTTTSETIPQNIEDHGKYYDATAKVPAKTPIADAQKNAQAVEVMKQFAQNAINSFKERGNFDNLTQTDINTLPFRDGRKEDFELTYKTVTGAKTVSYIFTQYEDTFGAHPNTYYRTFTFDTKTGEGLELSDLFAPSANFPATLSTLARKTLPAQLAKAANEPVSQIDMDYLNRGTTPDADNFQNWYIDGKDLVIIFAPYQVAAYVFGAPELRLPLASIPGISASYK